MRKGLRVSILIIGLASVVDVLCQEDALRGSARTDRVEMWS